MFEMTLISILHGNEDLYFNFEKEFPLFQSNIKSNNIDKYLQYLNNLIKYINVIII